MPENSRSNSVHHAVGYHPPGAGGLAREAAPEPPASLIPGLPQDIRASVAWLSGGNVGQVASFGPVLATHQPRRRLRRSTMTPALSRADRAVIGILAAGWLASLVFFWSWWLSPVHYLGLFGLVVNSVVLAYVSCFPALFVAGASMLRKVGPWVRVPGVRVAFVVTRSPSESWEIARSTLVAMLAQDYPRDYDVWLCDERPGAEILSWCRRNGVRVSTRDGVRDYHRRQWPRRTRCKEGNLAYFYDHWGYWQYDAVAQLDCDHRPAPTYLAEMMRPFADPAVGYVAAPSVCDTNAGASWAARGRVYREATFHGPFQLGHSNGLGPLCIGSHYAVRTAALRDIGGIGPELAEDFSTTFLLNVAGWQGVFAIDAQAHGDGPETFTAMTVQEYQWSRSLTTILSGLLPRNISRLPWRLRMRFLYALTYYFLLAGITLAGFTLAPVAAVTGVPWISVGYVDFLAHWWLIPVWLIVMIALLRRRGLLRPPTAPVLSWESWLYGLTRWPYVAWGIAGAIRQRLRPRHVTFQVTPKREQGARPLAARTMLPYVAISVGSAVAAVFGERHTTAAGYVLLCLLAAILYAIVVLAVPALHVAEMSARTGLSKISALRLTARGPAALAVVTVAVVAVAIASFPAYAAPLLSG
ncbi:MAG TPA: glycosyltransferase family 2 protein [Streptosporangiaceae bacterium]